MKKVLYWTIPLVIITGLLFLRPLLHPDWFNNLDLINGNKIHIIICIVICLPSGFPIAKWMIENNPRKPYGSPPTTAAWWEVLLFGLIVAVLFFTGLSLCSLFAIGISFYILLGLTFISPVLAVLYVAVVVTYSVQSIQEKVREKKMADSEKRITEEAIKYKEELDFHESQRGRYGK